MARGAAAGAKTHDSLGNRMTFGVIVPSTNTSVQAEFDAMRPVGVTNHTSRCIIPDTRVTDDKSFMVMLNNIRASVPAAIESVMSANVDRVVMGMSAETFWDGKEGSKKLQKKVDKIAGSHVIMGSDACQAALHAYGRKIKRLGIITPYMPVGDNQVHRFFTDCGFEVVNLLGLKCQSPVLIAHVTKQRLRDAIHRQWLSRDKEHALQGAEHLIFRDCGTGGGVVLPLAFWERGFGGEGFMLHDG